MTIADWLIVLTVATSVLIGLIRGFVVEVMALVVWAVAFLAALTVGPGVSDILVQRIETPSARILFAYALVFVATLMIGAIATWLLRKLVQETGLTGTDRLLGAVFGVARGIAIVVLIVLMLGLTPFPRDRWWRESRLLPAIVAMAEQIRAWLPEWIATQIQYDRSEREAPPRAPESTSN